MVHQVRYYLEQALIAKLEKSCSGYPEELRVQVIEASLDCGIHVSADTYARALEMAIKDQEVAYVNGHNSGYQEGLALGRAGG